MSRLADVSFVEGPAAAALLPNPAFADEWRRLWSDCAWATRFQSPEYVLTWYSVYSVTHQPVLIRGVAGDGSLAGLLCLAAARDGSLQSAGGRQAEYQCWLAAPGAELDFPSRAFAEISRRLGGEPFRMHYLPPGIPLQGLTEGGAPPLEIEAVPRPVMELSLEEIERSWKKKIKNSRLNQLSGEVTFERVTTVDGLRQIIDEVAILYDLRQASMFGSMPFTDDPQKKAFHLELMKHPGLLDVTVLRTGGRFFAAHIGVVSPLAVHIGMLVHSPLFSRHSPGRTHMLYLTRLLASEGRRWVDLTPGDDPWKERFATQHDEVKRLRLYRRVSDLQRAVRSQHRRDQIRAAAAKAGVSPQSVAKAVAAVRGKSPGQVVRSVAGRARGVLPHTVELRAYTMDLAGVKRAENAAARRDAIEDLLLFEEQPDSPDKKTFLKGALARLEAGHHCYTIVEQGRLVHWGWLATGQPRGFMEEVHQLFTFPAGSVTLYDFYTHPAARGRGHYRKTLQQMLDDASGVEGQAFIFVTADNGPSRHVIEKTGFAYRSSLFEKISWGTSTKWRSDGPVEVEPPPDSDSPAS